MAATGGGAIRSTSNVTVESSTLSNNSVISGNGGSIQGADVSLTDTVVTDILTLPNAVYGGAIDGTNVDLVDSHISGTRADRGGAINAVDVDLTRSTLTDDRAEQSGGPSGRPTSPSSTAP